MPGCPDVSQASRLNIMAKEKSKTLRVTVTLREGSFPQWFALLSKVESGFTRSEIIRNHLMPPSEELLKRYIDTPVHEGALRKSAAQLLERSPEPENRAENKPDRAPSKAAQNNDGQEKDKVDTSSLTCSPYRSSGLTKKLLGEGLKFAGEK